MAEEDLARDFAAPPQEAKPWVYWWFEGGWGNPPAMARDIAEMKAKGIGGVLHMQTVNQGGLPLPKEIKMLSPEWETWFAEMVRLPSEAGMGVAASIVDGWAHGGSWIGPAEAAKQLVYSETQVDGPGKLAAPLPQPRTVAKLYRDVAVVAFKERTLRPAPPREVTANNVDITFPAEMPGPAADAVDGDPETYWCTRKPGAKAPKSTPARLDLDYGSALRAVGAFLVIPPTGGVTVADIEASDDGTTWRAVTHLTLKPGESRRVEFAPVEARRFRLSLPEATERSLQVAEFQILRQGDEPWLRRGIKWWGFKSANRGWWGQPPNPYEALEEQYPEDGTSDVTAAGVLDLSDKLQADGRLDWEAPAGRWTILRFGWTPVGELSRLGSGGYEADVLNTKYADLVMDKVAQPMRDLSVKHAGGAPILFHTDSWEIGVGVQGQQPTWTDDFREQFRKRRGYDLLAYLPALAHRLVDSRETTERFLRDDRDTVSDLIAAYYGRLQERAHQMNGGIDSESGYGSYPDPQMDGLQVFGRSDRPMAEQWHTAAQPQYLTYVDIMRTAASSARIYGHRFVQAETLTAFGMVGLVTAPVAYRRALHDGWARGLNQAVIHKYTHQPFEDKPGLIDYDVLNRHMSWWPLADGFISYLSRAQALLQRGDFVADAAFFVGEGATRFVPGRKFLKPELPDGYDYDGINAEALLTRADVKDGRLVLPNGPSYRYLVFCEPQCVTMRPETLGKIRRLVEHGLTLVGKRPTRTPGLTDLAASESGLKADADALWGAEQAEQGDRKVGKGRVVWGRPLGELLAADGNPPDCEATRSGKPFEISWLHRRSGDEEIYFLANPLNQQVDILVNLRAKGRSVRLFDPLDGSTRDLPETSVAADGRTTVPLRFEPEQAYFVVVGNSNSQAIVRNGEKNFPELKPVQELTGPWQVSFDTAWVAPLPTGVAANAPQVTVTFDPLVDWTKRPEEGIKAYSGVAVYRKVFDCQLPAVGDPLYLSLGEINNLGRVRLNGRELGVAWCPPWRVTIPKGLLKAQGNELVIEVANLWNNRLVADAALPAERQLTKMGKGCQGWMLTYGRPHPSGLLGPVRLVSAPVTTLPTK